MIPTQLTEIISGVAGRRLGAKLRFWRSPGGEAEAKAVANDGTGEGFSP